VTWTTRKSWRFLDFGSKYSTGSTAALDGGFEDLTEDVIQTMDKTLSRTETFSFYEFMLDARYRWLMHDYVAGFLMAVIALEGVHSAFVNVCLVPKIEKMGKSKISQDSIEVLVKDVGFYALIRLSPILFMNENERPQIELMDTCLEAISSRNKLVHSLKKKGKPTTRPSGFHDISGHYDAVVKMYECFLSALERRLN
jgi:hypothetical protein